MKKLLLGAVMAAFVVTGAYGDDVINDKTQTRYIEYIKKVDECLKETSKILPNLQPRISNLKDVMKNLLTIDQNDAAKKSKKYTSRKENLTQHRDSLIKEIDGFKINDDNREKLKEFKVQVQTAKIEGNKLLEREASRNKIQEDFKENAEDRFNIDNAYIEVRGYLYDCWDKIEKTLTKQGIKTDVELAEEEAAKKAAEEAAAKKAAEEAAAKKAAEEAAAKKAAEEKERERTGRSTRRETLESLRQGGLR